MKFIHVTDLHIMGRTPKYRKDDFLQTILEKIEWVQKYAEDIEATAILCTGDLFDRADTAYSVLNDVIPVMRRSKVPWVSVIGNHDEYGYNPDTILRTPMGTLMRQGIVTHVGYNYKSYDCYANDTDIVVITGCDSTIQTDNREDKEYDYGVYSGEEIIFPLDPEDMNKKITTIHLSHGFLANKNWGDKIHHTQINEIYDKVEADIVLAGHEHSGFGIVKTPNGKLFVNGGALGRITAGVGDINREVMISEITVENGVYDAKLVPVAIARDVDEVMDLELARKEKERIEILNNFTESANEIQVEEADDMNVFEYIDVIRNELFCNTDLPATTITNIVNRAKEAIQKAHENVGGRL